MRSINLRMMLDKNTQKRWAALVYTADAGFDAVIDLEIWRLNGQNPEWLRTELYGYGIPKAELDQLMKDINHA